MKTQELEIAVKDDIIVIVINTGFLPNTLIGLSIAETSADNVDRLVQGIGDQAETPPGKDPIIGSFYRALYNKYSGNDPKVVDLLTHLCEVRSSSTPAHLAKIIWGSFHSVMMEVGNGYPLGYDSENPWTECIDVTLTDVNSREKLLHILREKDTTTTIYQRYVSARYLLPFLVEQSDVLRIADFGCGANYGLPGIAVGEPFIQVIDNTRDKLFAGLPRGLPGLEGYAVDKRSPYTDDFRQWLRSCGRYPTEIQKGGAYSDEDLNHFEQRLRGANGSVQFIQADLTGRLDSEFPRNLDAIVVMTMLYQHKESSQRAILHNARSAVSKTGVIIVQDFLSIDGKTGGFMDSDRDPKCSNFGTVGAYRTFIISSQTGQIPLEILRWNGGRCNEVWEGCDYDKFREIYISGR